MGTRRTAESTSERTEVPDRRRRQRPILSMNAANAANAASAESAELLDNSAAARIRPRMNAARMPAARKLVTRINEKQEPRPYGEAFRPAVLS